EDAPNRRMRMHERTLGIQADALEVAADGLDIPRRKRGQQLRSVHAFAGGTDDAAHAQSIPGRGLQAVYRICAEVDRSAPAVRLASPSVTILQDSVAGSRPPVE